MSITTPTLDTFDPALADSLAAMSWLSDSDHAACPQEWRDLTALMHTLIEDEGMATGMVAAAAGLPEDFVAAYRRHVGI